MKVIVTKTAFFNGALVHPGAELEVPDATGGSWFVKASTSEAKAAKPAKPAKAEPKALSQLNKDQSFIDVHDKQDLA